MDSYLDTNGERMPDETFVDPEPTRLMPVGTTLTLNRDELERFNVAWALYLALGLRAKETAHVLVALERDFAVANSDEKNATAEAMESLSDKVSAAIDATGIKVAEVTTDDLRAIAKNRGVKLTLPSDLPPVEVTEGEPKVTGVDDTGLPVVVTKKEYALKLTHEEMHVFDWALTIAESIVHKDLDTYMEALRSYHDVTDSMGTDAMLLFESKVEAAHSQMRVDDGEKEK